MIASIARIARRLISKNTSLPLTLGLRNMYILPTRYGLLYLGILFSMLIGSINYNNNLGFLLAFLLASLGLVAMLHTYSMLYGLQLTSARAQAVFAGQLMDLDIRTGATNRARIDLNWFVDRKYPTEMSLLPGGPSNVRVRVPTHSRGVFTPGRLRISSTYPLGLFRVWTRIDPHVSSFVYPQPLAGYIVTQETQTATGVGKTSGASGAEDFAGLRAYQPGDSPGRIHWQSYSRGRGLHVKAFSGQSGQAQIFDIKRVQADNIEKKLSILCHHVVQAEQQQRPFGLILDNHTIPVGTGKTHSQRCLEALSLYKV